MDYFLMGLIATIVVLAAVAIGAVVYNECIAKRNAYVNVPKQNI